MAVPIQASENLVVQPVGRLLCIDAVREFLVIVCKLSVAYQNSRIIGGDSIVPNEADLFVVGKFGQA